VSHNRIVAMYFFASLTFLVAGLCLSSVIQHQTIGFQDGGEMIGGPPPPDLHPYQGLGLSLYGFGMFLVVATFYQSLAREKKKITS
jgi:hypothetical protein